MFNKKHSILNKERRVLREGGYKVIRVGDIWRTTWKGSSRCNDISKLRHG
jgi:hypothetical protein